MQNAKPDYTTSIVTVKAGQTIPDTFLQKLIAENRSAIGFVIQDKKLEVEKFPDAGGTLGTVDKVFADMKDILKNTVKFQRMFCFQNFPLEYDEDERQPWTIIKDSKGSPMLVVALEGDLPGRDIDGSSEMLGTINEYLGPKIEALFTLVGNDPKKLYAALKDQKGFGADLMNLIGHRAVFAFMPTEGDIFAHGKNEIGGHFSWGTASLAYDYTESAIAAATPLPAADAPKRSKYASSETIATDDNGIHTLPPKEPKVEPIIPKVDPKPSTDPVKNAADAAADGHWETPPANLHGKNLKKWYRQMDPAGELIPDWNKKPRVFVKHKTTVTSLAELSQTALATVQKVEQPVAVLPVIDGKQQAAAKEFIAKFLDGASNQTDNPLELQKQEAQLAVFSELCLKGSLDDIERWKTSAIAAFCKSHPEAAWLLIIELRRDRMNRKQLALAGDKKVVELVGTHVPTKVTEPAASPALTPSPETAPAPVHKKSKYA